MRYVGGIKSEKKRRKEGSGVYLSVHICSKRSTA